MDIVALLVVVAALWLAFKLVGFALRSAMWLLVLGGLYWLPAAVALALVGGLVNAWALLVEILR